MRFWSTVGLLALVVTLGACAPRTRWKPLDLEALPGRETWPTADAAILDSREKITFHPGKDGAPAARIERNHVVRILGEKGRALARVAEGFKTGHSQVLRFDARLVLPGGETRERTLSEAVEWARYRSFVLYSDHRGLQLDLGPAPLGSVVHSRSVTALHDVRDQAFTHAFGDLHPTVHRALEVVAPAGWEVIWSAEAGGTVIDWPPRRETVPEGTRYVWEARDLPALAADPHAPPPWFLARQVVVRLARWREGFEEKTGAHDVEDLAARHWRDYRDRAVAGPALRAQVARLLAATPPDPASQARALFEWVRDEIPYCAIAIGDGDWRPHAAEEVFDVRYGDCKDKAILLHTMLETAGIPSRPALIWSHEGYPRPFRFDRLGHNFNHVVVQLDLPGGPLVVDPTARHSAFGHLPLQDQGADLLPLAAEGGRVVRLPVAGPDVNRWRWSAEARVAPDGKATGTFVLEAHGTRAAGLRRLLFAHAGSERLEALAQVLDLRRLALHEATFEGTRPDPDLPVRAQGRVTTPRLLEGAGRTRMLRPAAFLEAVVPSLPPRRRATPLVLPLPGRHTVVLDLTLPEGARVASVPPEFDLEGPVGRYRLVWSQPAGGRLRLERELVRERHIVPAAEVPAARTFFDAVLAAESRPVVLELP